jgi:ketosteroid isomerase-like protein
MRVAHRALASLALLTLASACAPKGPTPDEMVEAANALDGAFLAAFNAGDINALMATYWNSPELVSIGIDGMGGTGWEGPKAGWEATFAAMPGTQLAFPTMHNIAAGDVVLGWGTWTMTIPNSDGTSTVLQGRYSDVKAQRDGKWVYIMDHASVPPPPAPAPAAAAAPTAN